MKKSKEKWHWIENIVNKEILENAYNNKSIPDVANEFNVHKKWVYAALKFYGIKIKSLAETSKLVSYKVKNTCKEKYGVECVFNREDVRKNCSSKDARKKAVESTKISNLKKYGVESSNNVPEIRIKQLNSYYNKSDKEKENIKNKRAATNLIKYGAINYMQSYDASLRVKEFKEKELITRRNNGTLCSSNPEKILLENLLLMFKEDEIIQQYNKDDRYPWHCDFYIKPLDLFIELNLYWAHGDHPFCENDENDLKIFNDWKERSKYSDHYQAACHTWTYLDVLKINAAKENNLNYICVYNNKKEIIFRMNEILNEYKGGVLYLC